MSHEFWIQLGIWIIGVLVFIAVNSFKIGQLEAKLATKDELKAKERERNSMIDRVYERFDEFKRLANEQFVRQDMCGQLHMTSKDELKRIDEEYKDFRHDIRCSVQKIYDEIGFQNKKIDELKELILKK